MAIFDDTGLDVTNGNVSDEADINDIIARLITSFNVTVENRLAALEEGANMASSWAVADVGTWITDNSTGTTIEGYSALAWGTEAKNWANNAQGTFVVGADGVTTSEYSAKAHAIAAASYATGTAGVSTLADGSVMATKSCLEQATDIESWYDDIDGWHVDIGGADRTGTTSGWKFDTETAKDLAEQWASEAEDVVVADGKYSAYHWAQKSEASALSSVKTVVAGDYTTVDSSDSENPVVDVDPYELNYGHNYAINSDFWVWQDGTSFSGITSSTYTADQWKVNRGTSTAGSIAVDRTLVGYGDNAWNGVHVDYVMRIRNTSTTGGTSALQLFNVIENVKTLEGKSVTLSFTLHNITGVSFNFTPKIVQYFGPGGSSSVTTDCNEGLQSCSGVGRLHYVVTFDIPDITGKTVVAGHGLYVYPIIAEANMSDCDFYIGAVKLEEGERTPYVKPTAEQNLRECYRYYWIESGVAMMGNGYMYASAGAGRLAGVIQYPVEMRVTPTVSVTGAGFINVVDDYLGVSASNSYTRFLVEVDTTNIYRVSNGTMTFDARL